MNYLLDTSALIYSLCAPAEIEGIKTLPPLHKDPFDRLIVSQARQNRLCVVTSDGIIPKYDVKTVW